MAHVGKLSDTDTGHAHFARAGKAGLAAQKRFPDFYGIRLRLPAGIGHQLRRDNYQSFGLSRLFRALGHFLVQHFGEQERQLQ